MTAEEALETLRRLPKDGEAWEVLAVHVNQPLLAYVASLLLTFRIGSGETANDIVNEVLLAFYERWPVVKSNFASVSDVHAYLKRSCRNLLIDRYRHERRAQQLVDFLALKFSGAFQDETRLYRSIFLDEIVEMLPPDCGALLKLYIEDDLSPAEMAERDGSSPSKFYARWYRCIQKAKNIFLQKRGGLERL